MPAEGWDGAARMAALQEAEARGDCYREGDNIVYPSLDAFFQHLAGVVERRPELLKSLQRSPESQAEDEAALGEVDDAIKSGKSLSVSDKLRAFLQRYQVPGGFMHACMRACLRRSCGACEEEMHLCLQQRAVRQWVCLLAGGHEAVVAGGLRACGGWFACLWP